MSKLDRQSGAVNALFVSGVVVVAVVGGAIMNRCLSCEDGAGAVTINPESIGHGRALRPADRVKNDPQPLAKNDTKPEGGVVNPDPTRDGTSGTDGTSRPKLIPLSEVKKNAGKPGKYLKLSFEKLGGYTYKFPEIGAIENDTNQIPKAICEEFDKKEVEIRGFIIPIRMKEDKIEEFVLVVNQLACCFGQVPKMNEWIHVTMAEGKTAPYEAVEVPAVVRGKMSVGELWENGIVMSLYRIEGIEVIPPKLR